MKSKINSWLVLVMCAICTTYSDNARGDACYGYMDNSFGYGFGSSSNSKAKNTKPGTWCTDDLRCPAGCYCKGEAGYSFVPASWKRFMMGGGGIHNILREGFEKLCNNQSSVSSDILQLIQAHQGASTYWSELFGSNKDVYKKSGTERVTLAKSLMQSIGMYTCPTSFPKSDAGASTVSECYVTVSGKKVYNKTVPCKAGQYLPIKSNSCTQCRSENKYYCPGGNFSTSVSTDMGLKQCPSGQVANSVKTGCIDSTTHCNPGQYLPRGATQCKDCKSRYYLCAGGPVTVGLTYDQGIRKCDGNMVANAENTSCVTDTVNLELIQPLYEGTISVPAGKYLPAGEKSPATCRGTTNYCPGGEFQVASVDQGIVECPKNTRANKDKTACSKSLTKIQMQYGPNGKNTPYSRQCWLKTNSADDFKACVFGTKDTD